MEAVNRSKLLFGRNSGRKTPKTLTLSAALFLELLYISPVIGLEGSA